MSKNVYLIGTRWFGILGPCKLLIDHLARKGYKVFVIGSRDDKYQQFGNIDCELIEVSFKRSYFSFFSDLKDLYKLISLVKRHPPEFIHSFNPKPSLFALILKKFSKAKLFIGVTGLGNTFIKDNFVTRLVRKVIKVTYNAADFLFFQNNDDIDYFKTNVLKDPSKIKHFISPGVDIERFTLKEYQSDNGLSILFVGRLLWQKGVDDFIDVAKRFEKNHQDKKITFTIVGQQDDSHPDRLRESDIQSIIDSEINWIEWTDSIEDFYKSHDVLVFMSHREGGPRAILEASACGLPTIGANSIGVKELIKNDVTGYLVELHDLSKIEECILQYYHDKTLVEEHGRNARKHIAEPLSLANATKAQLEMYEL